MLCALVLWVFGGGVVDATTAALVVVSGLVLTGTVGWDDLIANRSAWNTLIWFVTLVTTMMAVAALIPGMNVTAAALALSMTLGLMGVITPYATGPGPIYAGSGYLPAKDFWRLGAIFGALSLIVFLAVGLPWLLWVE